MAGFIAVHTGKKENVKQKQQFKDLSFSIGAGNCLDETKYKRVCKEACVKATSILKAGGTTLDACEAAIVCLENSGNTNAGEIQESGRNDPPGQHDFHSFFISDFH